MEQEFDVTCRAPQRRLDLATDVEAELARCVGDAVNRGATNRGLAHDALWRVGGVGLELRLDERNDLAAVSKRGLDRGQYPGQRNERHVRDGDARALGQLHVVGR